MSLSALEPIIHSVPLDTELSQPGNPILNNLIVNNLDQGNNGFDLVFNRFILNQGPAAIIDGFTIRISIDGSSWFALDFTSSTISIVDNRILVRNNTDGKANSFSSGHRLDVAYAAASGDIFNTNFPAEPLEDIAATETLTVNASSIDFTSGQDTDLAFPDDVGGDHYILDEGANLTREPVQNTAVSDYDMASVNLLGVRLAPDGVSNAIDLTNGDYALSVDAWTVEDNDRNSAGVWVLFDTLPSVLGASGQNAYPMHRWASVNNRAWAMFVNGRGDVSLDDIWQFNIHSESDTSFGTRGDTITTGVWRYYGASHFSGGASGGGSGSALKAYNQDFNDPSSFVEYTPALIGTVSDLTMKKNTTPVASGFGFANIAPDHMDGGVAHGFFAKGIQFSAAAHKAIAEKPRPWPYFVEFTP